MGKPFKVSGKKMSWKIHSAPPKATHMTYNVVSEFVLMPSFWLVLFSQ